MAFLVPGKLYKNEKIYVDAQIHKIYTVTLIKYTRQEQTNENCMNELNVNQIKWIYSSLTKSIHLLGRMVFFRLKLYPETGYSQKRKLYIRQIPEFSRIHSKLYCFISFHLNMWIHVTHN